jgi:hypothetical protein
MNANELTDEDLIDAESEAMQRPSNSAMWDDRLYVTHVPVMSWAERGDDILSESNYLTALDMLRGAADIDSDEHVIDATISDWLVGSLRQIFVQTRTDDGAFTPAFREAVAIAYALRDYPVLDESDYSEREFEEFERQFADALNDAQNDYERLCEERENNYPDDGLHDRITEELRDTLSNGSGFEYGELPNCDYAAVSRDYSAIADRLTSGDWEAYARQLSNPQVESLF